MPKDGVYKKRSNPNKETKHSCCDNPKSKTRQNDQKTLEKSCDNF